jgi:hypothetical protein
MLPSLLQTGSVRQVKDECPKPMDLVGSNGGFIMGPSCPLDEANRKRPSDGGNNQTVWDISIDSVSAIERISSFSVSTLA